MRMQVRMEHDLWLVGTGQVLCVDWCKYNDCVLATGSVDRTIKVWDVRAPDREVSVLAGHAYAVRRWVFITGTRFQPSACTGFRERGLRMRALYSLKSVCAGRHLCASNSTCALMFRGAAYLTSLPPDCRVLFSPHAENIVASCSYDMTVRLWDVAAPQDALLRVCGQVRLPSLHPCRTLASAAAPALPPARLRCRLLAS